MNFICPEVANTILGPFESAQNTTYQREKQKQKKKKKRKSKRKIKNTSLAKPSFVALRKKQK